MFLEVDLRTYRVVVFSIGISGRGGIFHPKIANSHKYFRTLVRASDMVSNACYHAPTEGALRLAIPVCVCLTSVCRIHRE